MSVSMQVPMLTRVQVPSPLLSNANPSDGSKSVGCSEFDEESLLTVTESLDEF